MLSSAGFDKRLKALFPKTGVKELDLNSKDVFSYNKKINYIIVFKKRVALFVSILITCVLLQIVSLIINYLSPEPRYFLTTFNGSLYKLEKPHISLENAVKINNQIDGSKKVIYADKE